MKKFIFIPMLFLAIWTQAQIADPTTYLTELKSEMQIEWPKNRTINIVFHGHSVPSGYFKTPQVNTMCAYPNVFLKKLKEIYPFAVVNVIVTAKGGENSVNGAARFESDVLIHKPDVILIDYALNDRGVGLEKAFTAWNQMIKQAKDRGIKVILLTPSPDKKVNYADPANELKNIRSRYVAWPKKIRWGWSTVIKPSNFFMLIMSNSVNTWLSLIIPTNLGTN